MRYFKISEDYIYKTMIELERFLAEANKACQDIASNLREDAFNEAFNDIANNQYDVSSVWLWVESELTSIEAWEEENTAFLDGIRYRGIDLLKKATGMKFTDNLEASNSNVGSDLQEEYYVLGKNIEISLNDNKVIVTNHNKHGETVVSISGIELRIEYDKYLFEKTYEPGKVVYGELKKD